MEKLSNSHQTGNHQLNGVPDLADLLVLGRTAEHINSYKYLT